ncbi:MAG: transcription elongation factor GreAB [Verrucomicrobiota bacterium]
MTKSDVLTAILARLEIELEALLKGAKASFAAATDPDSKAENKYDTRTLEASYVARGQAQRVTELQEAVRAFGAFHTGGRADHGAVRQGSLVGLELGGSVDHYFIGPAEGGLEITVDGREVMVITPASPLGARLMGKEAGEKMQLPSGQAALVKSVA